MSLLIKVAKRLKELRLDSGISQGDFSEMTGIDRTYLSHIEAGRRNLSIDTLETILKGLKIDAKTFFDHSGFRGGKRSSKINKG